MRICLYGGPGCGKSTLALWLTASLKEAHLNIEYIDEWIKQWAYEKKQIKGWDQYRVFNCQIYKEQEKLQAGVEHIVTDAPILMQIGYMRRNRSPYADICRQTARLWEDEHPALNIRLLRGGFDYKAGGRWENEAEALMMDEMIKEVMDENLKDYVEFRAVDREEILSEVFLRLRCYSC